MESSRVRLVDFSDRAVEIELFAYVLTADFSEFLAVRENLLLQVVSIVESSGSGFAQPTQFVYMDSHAGADGQRASRSRTTTCAWGSPGRALGPSWGLALSRAMNSRRSSDARAKRGGGDH